MNYIANLLSLGGAPSVVPCTCRGVHGPSIGSLPEMQRYTELYSCFVHKLLSSQHAHSKMKKAREEECCMRQTNQKETFPRISVFSLVSFSDINQTCGSNSATTNKKAKLYRSLSHTAHSIAFISNPC